ncbi:MAG: acetyl-CoA carboxylase biotin carboxylase subunit [Nitrospiria bacterium]
MFKKVLVANRGEIALRVIRACKELKIPTVAIHSEVDSTTLYVKKADEACLVGPGPVAGYLNIYRIIELATQKGADAIHPGYGFLAENPEFAEACAENGITFIGPPAHAIRSMGNKVLARQTVRKLGVPVVPGVMESLRSGDEALQAAKEIGYPLILKATAGGGGRGMRICRNNDELRKNFPMASSEAQKAFGQGDLYLEKYIEGPHHIEFQIMADRYGHVIHLGERDCSIQRRYQKLVEIAPSLLLDAELRRRMGETAVKVAQAVGYQNVGTVEFLVDKNRNFYFLEMNTRIQVEHTITEEVTGIDIVKEMICLAAGKPLSLRQEDIDISGHAIECRINAEDPMRDFLPSTGKITAYYSPGGFGVRIDGNAYRGYVVPSHYDSLLAKLTVWGRTWEEVVDRTHRSLDEFVIRGVKTTIPLYVKILEDEAFRRGDFDIQYIDLRLNELMYTVPRNRTDLVAVLSAAIAAYSRR